MKRNKKILFGALAVVFILLMMPINPAVDTDDANNVETVDDVTNFLISNYKMSTYWGNEDMPLTNGSGYFDTYQDENGTWWFVDPEGYAFYSAGVACVNLANEDYNATIHEKYGSIARWANETRDNLSEWGFNTLGCWSGILPEMPYTIKCIGAKGGAREGWKIYVHKNGSRYGKRIPDVFDSRWWDCVRENFSFCFGETVENLKDDPWLIGYWLDNEIQWESNYPPFDQNTLLETYISVPNEYDQPGKTKVVKFLINRYEDDGIDVFNEVWNMNLKSFDELYNVTKLGRTGWIAQHFIPRVKDDIQDFTQLVAHFYFKNITEIVRNLDPNHLILGVRFHLFGTPEDVIRECGNYCDVISINYYRQRVIIYDPIKYLNSRLRGTVPLDKWMQEYYGITEEANNATPLIVGEFGCAVSIFPLVQDLLDGAFKFVRTQKGRADYFEWYARNCLKAPYVIGYHWFPYAGDKGLVSNTDDPYDDLVTRTAYINNLMYELHNS